MSQVFPASDWPRRLGIAALVLILVALCGAWLTGRVVANQLVAALNEPVTLGSARITLAELEPGVLRTDVRYAVEWPLGNGETAHVGLAQRIDHGPWPMNLLAHGRVLPAVFASEIHAAESRIVRDGGERALPLRLDGEIHVSYAGRVDIDLSLDAPDIPLGAISLVANGLRLSAHYAHFDHVAHAQMEATQLALRQGGEATAQLDGARYALTATLHDEQPDITLTGKVTMLGVWGQAIGPLQQSVSMSAVRLPMLTKALGGEASAWEHALPPGSRLDATLLSVKQRAGEARLMAQKSPTAPGLQLRFGLPKAVVHDAVGAPLRAKLGESPDAIIAQQAAMAYALISGQLMASGLVQAKDDGLHAALDFSAEGVSVNGEKHDWPSFRARFFPLAP